MTEKLFYQDAYSTEFKACVRECEAVENGFRILLDRTLFFPLEGGQTPDRGTLNDYEVFDVQIKNDEIYHFTYESFEVGEEVTGKIDWDHRFSNMQMHTGEHIFSGFINKEFGYNNVGFHLSDSTATMDYDGKLTDADVERIEEIANKAIWEAHEVKCFFPSEKELEKLEYRSKSGILGEVRIVLIDGVDICACCAPHVKNTSEVGLLKIISHENYKGGTRLNFLCGKRAFLDYRRLAEVESSLSRTLNSKKEDILQSVDKIRTDNEELKYSITAIRREKISKNCMDAVDGLVFLNPEDGDQLRFAVSELFASGKEYALVFAGNDENGYRFIIESEVIDFNNMLNELRSAFGAKGGGKNGSFQGSVNADKDELIFLANKYIHGE